MMNFVSPNTMRTQFSRSMSAMYGKEVPAYTTLLSMVSSINQVTLENQPELRAELVHSGNLARITEERHGAIRLGNAAELHTMRRLFSVMGMYPVGYYDLSVAGIPVHSTAFRPVVRESLAINPFRVFTSLLRLDLLDDETLKADAKALLNQRDIFPSRVRELIEVFETNGGLTESESTDFIKEALVIFRWHSESTVSEEMYQRLHHAHRLVADVVSFKGPHINHLTPRTLDIDRAQADMPQHGINPKAVIEGPPPRNCPLLLRQTSFKALEESVSFLNHRGQAVAGTHTARFGEIEQRGVALTRKGRQCYDELLHQARERANSDESVSYEVALAEAFSSFPDDWNVLRKEGLAFFEYHASSEGLVKGDLETMINDGAVTFIPIIYEDFLPVSAAGIFQSNLGEEGRQNFVAHANQAAFEEALGATVADEFVLYETIEQNSINHVLGIH
ncbi:MAG: 2-oxoadipate dioxygenase/decarboxylase HglS [Ostreibacterium sp.]